MITILFGAGASNGSGLCYFGDPPSAKNPPLGMNLFEMLEKQKGAFFNLPESIKEIFRSLGFEAGMAEISNTSKSINPLQREIALYLSNFDVQPQNAYVRLFRKIKIDLPKITISTLNYDLLIEQALHRNGFKITYSNDDKGILVLKPHGSSNFLVDIKNNVQYDIEIEGGDVFFEGFENKAVANHNELLEWCNDKTYKSFSPTLAMYAKGKRVVINKSLIDGIQNLYAEKISKSKLVIIVGVGYVENDSHIWDPIVSSKPHIVIVDPYPDSISSWAQRNGLTIEVFRKVFESSAWDITKAVHRFR